MLKFALIRQYLYILKRKNGKRIQKGLYNTLVFASFLELFFCIIFLPGSKFDKSKDNFLLLHYVKKIRPKNEPTESILSLYVNQMIYRCGDRANFVCYLTTPGELNNFARE